MDNSEEFLTGLNQDCEIVYAVNTVSQKSGNNMLKLEIKITDINGNEKKVYDYIVYQTNLYWKLKQVCDAFDINMPSDGEKIDVSNISGKKAKCKTFWETQEYNGEKITRIKAVDYTSFQSNDNYFNNSNCEDVNNDVNDDDIPF